MEGGAARLSPDGAKNPQHQPTQPTESICKSPRSGKKLTIRRHDFQDETQPQTPRTSLKPQKDCELPLLLTTVAGYTNGKLVKRRQDTEDENLSDHESKRFKYNIGGELKPAVSYDKDKFIEAWLSPIDEEKSLGELETASEEMASEDSMPPKSNETKRITPYNPSFREIAAFYNIYINERPAPDKLLRRAKEITEKPRSSTEVGEDTLEWVKDISGRLSSRSEQNVVQQLAAVVIPGIPKEPLDSVADKDWSDYIPVPLSGSFLSGIPALSEPRPDKVFGYSRKAFTKEQLDIIFLLRNPSGQSYVRPDSVVLFPFWDIELKTHDGSLNVAANQAANAAAVIGHGLVELARRASELGALDYNEPQLFSLTMDNEVASVYVHWLSVGSEDGQHSFHTTTFSMHQLTDLHSLRGLQRTVNNILDWGKNERLKLIREQLDTYAEKLRAGTREVKEGAAESAGDGDELPGVGSQRGQMGGDSITTATSSSTTQNRTTMRQAWPAWSTLSTLPPLPSTSEPPTVPTTRRTQLTLPELPPIPEPIVERPKIQTQSEPRNMYRRRRFP
ncbi:hypothetical protein GP486_005787 [Trichoglossum hirsutum]|uniref:DUF7924 domain-containing protein n=1 Tax=Trichoglossum hirsutum TaxID=265104 RepID=A0A9P8L8P4_9PEZI|nr:hypothetical protein GP486_005787 [Trichoglossum hirsutum]